MPDQQPVCRSQRKSRYIHILEMTMIRYPKVVIGWNNCAPYPNDKSNDSAVFADRFHFSDLCFKECVGTDISTTVGTSHTFCMRKPFRNAFLYLIWSFNPFDIWCKSGQAGDIFFSRRIEISTICSDAQIEQMYYVVYLKQVTRAVAWTAERCNMMDSNETIGEVARKPTGISIVNEEETWRQQEKCARRQSAPEIYSNSHSHSLSD